MEKSIDVLVFARNKENHERIFSAVSNMDDLQITGIETDETSTLIKTERLKPDVLIMDLQPPGLDALELAPIIHRRSPDTSIIMICSKDDDDYAGRALKAGIAGFLLRKEDMNKLPHIIKIVNLGGYYFSASIVKRALEKNTMINQFPNQVIKNFTAIKSKHENIDSLFSNTELAVIKNITKGFSDKETAEYLNLSAGTVKNCLIAIKRKTKLRNRLHIALFSILCGLVDLEQVDV